MDMSIDDWGNISVPSRIIISISAKGLRYSRVRMYVSQEKHFTGTFQILDTRWSRRSRDRYIRRQVVDVPDGRLGRIKYFAVIWGQRDILLKTHRKIGLVMDET